MASYRALALVSGANRLMSAADSIQADGSEITLPGPSSAPRPLPDFFAGKADNKRASGSLPPTLMALADSVTDRFTGQGLATYYASGSVTGAIVFLAPANSTTIAHALQIVGQNATAPHLMHSLVGGYRGNAGAAWQRTVLAHLGSMRPSVRLARKAVYNSSGATTSFQNAIIVGDANTVWSSPQIALTAALVNRASAIDAYLTGWTAELATSLDAPVNGGAAGYDNILLLTDTGLASKLDDALVSTFSRTLLDDTSQAAWHTTLGLGGAARLAVGAIANTVAAGNDPRIVGALRFDVDQSTSPAQKAQARSNLGVQSAGTYTVEGLVLTGNAVGDALARKASIGRRAIADVSDTIAATDSYVCLTSLTAKRTLTLPAASAYPAGQALYVADESGVCGEGKEIEVARAGSDTIAGQTSILVASPYQKIVFHSNGSNLWTVM